MNESQKLLKQMRDMSLNEIISFPNGFEALRVPGGWIYTNIGYTCAELGCSISSIFIPLCNDFEDKS